MRVPLLPISLASLFSNRWGRPSFQVVRLPKPPPGSKPLPDPLPEALPEPQIPAPRVVVRRRAVEAGAALPVREPAQVVQIDAALRLREVAQADEPAPVAPVRSVARADAAPPVREVGLASVEAPNAAWDEALEQARVEAWAMQQAERSQKSGQEALRKEQSRRARRRGIALVIVCGVGWAVLNARVRSLGGSDDTLGHALGRAIRTRSLFPLKEFSWRLSSRGAWNATAAWAGGAHVLNANDLKGASALECDVAVVGATPSGVAAALAAARRGAQVIVVERRPHAGGDVVYAMLNMFDVMARPGETARVHGLFAEFFEQLGVSCDIDRARDLFDNALKAEPNVRFIPNVEVNSVYKDGDKLAGIHIKQGNAGRAIACKVLVDATNDADVAAMAGSGYYIGREDSNPDKKMQSAGLLFSVQHVKWGRVRDYVAGRRLISAGERENRRYAIDITPYLSRAQKLALARARRLARAGRKTGALEPGLSGLLEPNGVLGRATKVWLRMGGGMGNYAWERGDVVRGYRPQGPDILVLSINFGRQSDGSVILNTLNILNVDGLDPQSRKHGRDEAVRELPYFLKYLRKKMPGFEHATLGRIAPELYIRETRHIHGHYALKVEDIRGRVKFFDRIAHAAYPLDLHPYSKTDLNPYGPQRYFYTLPLRSLIPRGVDNVFVASRSLSATYSAAGSARVIPVTMAAGEAAGVAAWQCARTGRTPHQLLTDYPLMRVVQDSLRKGGADLGD